MRLARLLSVLAVPALLLAGCSSGNNEVAPTVTTASSSARPSPSPSPTPPPAPAPASQPPPPPPPTDPLTGGAVVAGPAIAAKIDNTSAGLPQYAVSEADIVYVEQVEGGLTRLMAVYHTALPTDVGNVRSVRTTDAELLPVFGVPALVFSGGAGGPIDALAATAVVPFSEDAGSPGFFRSDSSSAPYNLHANLQTVAANASLSQPNSPGFVFAATDPRVDAGPAATSLAVQFQAARTGFIFTDGRYQLLRNGETQSDASGAPIVTDNVLFQNVDFEPDGNVDSVGSPSFISHSVGSGTFTLYRDGHAISGSWNRPAADQPTQYLDGAGQPVPFKPGKTWVALVPPVASTDVS